MTVAALSSAITYVENGVTLSFALPFRFLAGSIVAERLFVDGSLAELAPGTDFTTSGGDTDAGGALLLVSSIAGATLRIRRATPRTQDAQYTDADRFPAASHEGALDRSMLIHQEQDEQIGDVQSRALLVPAGETMVVLPERAARAGKALMFDASGGLILVDLPGSVGGGQDKWPFTASAGQTLFPCPGSAGLTVDVSINGVPIETDDFSHVGDDVILDLGADENDRVNVVAVLSVLQMQARASATTFSALGGGASDSVSQKLAQWPNPIDYPWSAAGDGVTDARNALVNADAVTPIIITGNHRISSNMTFTNRVMFVGRGRLTIDAGVTVTFLKGVSAGDWQIFYGAGAVAGLAEVRVAWFAGDLSGVNSNAVPAIQKALDACVTGAAVAWTGTYYSDGAPILLRKGQKVQAVARLLWRTSVTNGVHIYDVEGGAVDGLSIDMANPDILATEGTAFLTGIGAPLSRFSNCIAKRGWIGRSSVNVNGTIWENVECYDMREIGVWAVSSDNVRDIAGSASAFSTPIDLSSNAGFLAGEAVLFSNGANGSYVYGTSGTRSHIIINDIEPTVGATATGGTSGAVATVTAVRTPHRLGALRLENRCEFFRGEASSYAGGKYYLTTDAAVDAHGSRPYAARFTDCDFDSGHLGASIQKCAQMAFVGCYFYARSSYNIVLEATARFVRFIATTSMAAWLDGLLVKAGAKGCAFDDGEIIGANRSGGSAVGASIEAGIDGFSLRGNKISGPALGYGGTPARPWIVGAGATAALQIGGNLTAGCANVAGQDNSTSGSKIITADIS